MRSTNPFDLFCREMPLGMHQSGAEPNPFGCRPVLEISQQIGCEVLGVLPGIPDVCVCDELDALDAGKDGGWH
jgi:hypothetical protein